MNWTEQQMSDNSMVCIPALLCVHSWELKGVERSWRTGTVHYRNFISLGNQLGEGEDILSGDAESTELWVFGKKMHPAVELYKYSKLTVQ